MSGVLGETREVFSKRLQNNPEQSLLARLSLVKWLRENGGKFGARAHNTQSVQDNPRYTGGITQRTGVGASVLWRWENDFDTSEYNWAFCCPLLGSSINPLSLHLWDRVSVSHLHTWGGLRWLDWGIVLFHRNLQVLKLILFRFVAW